MLPKMKLVQVALLIGVVLLSAIVQPVASAGSPADNQTQVSNAGACWVPAMLESIVQQFIQTLVPANVAKAPLRTLLTQSSERLPGLSTFSVTSLQKRFSWQSFTPILLPLVNCWKGSTT
jgi:hypothetical protein